MEPVPAYDLWSGSYDDTDNLLLALDASLFNDLIRDVDLRAHAVVDVGCGTGRHWSSILASQPKSLVGVDASAGMLSRLRQKHPGADVRRTESHLLPGIQDGSCDVLVSTLALAHFPDADAAAGEWARVLRPGGDAIVTDLHPEAVARGACTFEHENRTVSIRLYSRDLSAIVAAMNRRGLQLVRSEERVIDQAVEPYFSQRKASDMFARLRGLPLVYGLRLRKV